ncbi:MAG: hypothetical protein P8J79_08290 [Halioglobus sp.]|nr:hypothetical protein [Halioglobus sp.]
MNILKFAAATALVLFSAYSFAAKPTSIVFKSNAETNDGIAYSNYTVKCSNGKRADLTAWNNRGKWCVGDASSDACEKKQIKAAKNACKSS